MTVFFQVVKDIVNRSQLDRVCEEMDLRMQQAEVDPGRNPVGFASRYKILHQLGQHPHTQAMVTDLVDRCIPEDERPTLIAFVRQHQSNFLHTDNNPNQGRGRTVLLPLRNIVEGVDRTVVFDHSTITDPRSDILDASEAKTRILAEARQRPPVADHMVRYQMEHCGPVVDHLRMAGVFEYRLGDAVSFDAHALHASSDWNRHSPERTHKDYLLMHTTHRDGLNYPESLPS